jgi:hypothetical protein
VREPVESVDGRVSDVTVRIGDREFVVTADRAFDFGRADADGVVGLDATDMGISSRAGSVFWEGVWFVANTSRKCPLYLDLGPVLGVQVLDCGHRHAINVEPLGIEVRGLTRTHFITVVVPPGDLARVNLDRPTNGTVVNVVSLSDPERDVAVAMFEGYLLRAPRHQPWPRTYAAAAKRLGGERTKDSVRKQMEHLRERLAEDHKMYFDGPRALYELADEFIRTRVITPDDLSRLPPTA